MRIKTGLTTIFDHLRRTNKGVLPEAILRIGPCLHEHAGEDDAVLDGQVFRAIVDMCETRILGRIASQRPDTTYSKTGRTFFGSTVQQVAEAVRKHGNTGEFRPQVGRFLHEISGLRARLNILETCGKKDVVLHLNDVIKAAYSLNITSDFDKIFLGIGPKELDPSTRTGFIARLGKLARYQECADDLLKLAKKKHHVFEHADVTTVSLDPQLFSRISKLAPECRLTSCLARSQSGAPVIHGARNIASILKLDLAKLKLDFISTVEKVLGQSRVHAEVQIVSYYELHPAPKMPRVIRSSKDACYLCNLFIQLHGAFYIPKTHGNLYYGWRVLPIPQLHQVQGQLIKALELRIRETIQAIMTAPNPRLMLSRNNNESTIFPFPPSSQSRLASSSSCAPAAATSSKKLGKPAGITQEIKPGLPPGRSVTPLHVQEEREPGLSPGLSAHTPPRRPPAQVEPPQVVLTRDQPCTLLVTTTTTTDSTREPRTRLPACTTETGLITLLPEFLASLPPCSRRPATASGGAEADTTERTRLRLHWLPAERAAAFYTARPRGFVDLEGTSPGLDIDADSREAVYIAYRGEVVVVEVLRGGD